MWGSSSSIHGATPSPTQVFPLHHHPHVGGLFYPLACSHPLLGLRKLPSPSISCGHLPLSNPHSFPIRAAHPDGKEASNEAADISNPNPNPNPSASECEAGSGLPRTSRLKRKTVFFVDIAPLCYRGKKPQPSALIGWMKSLFDNVTARQPIVAVMDGERGNEYRRHLLSTYKANRNAFVPLTSSMNRQTWKGDDADLREAFPFIKSFLDECHVPIVSVEDAEADDVVASLTEQAVQKGMQVIIASPDKDFKQLLCADVQIVAPLADLERWSFYTYKQYFAQHNCDPGIELGLRCMLGDKADNIPGLADIVPGFGRNTALKLMQKHGSLESLLNAAAIRTVGKPYVQNALTEHAPLLWKNLEVLRLRRDIPVCLEEEWCVSRKTSDDLEAFSKLENHLKKLQVQRTLKDGLRAGSFSDHVLKKSSKYKMKNITPIAPKN